MDELPVSSTYTALTAECPLAFSLSTLSRSGCGFSGQLAHETIPCWWEDACFIADMLSVVLRLERRRSGSHTHIGTEKPSCPSDLSIRGSQADGTDERSRNNSIFHPANLYLWSHSAAIDSALAWLFTHSPEERRSERQKWGRRMLGKARRLINVTLVYTDRGLWGEWRQDSYTKMPSCLLLVCAPKLHRQGTAILTL